MEVSHKVGSDTLENQQGSPKNGEKCICVLASMAGRREGGAEETGTELSHLSEPGLREGRSSQTSSELNL